MFYNGTIEEFCQEFDYCTKEEFEKKVNDDRKKLLEMSINPKKFTIEEIENATTGKPDSQIDAYTFVGTYEEYLKECQLTSHEELFKRLRKTIQ